MLIYYRYFKKCRYIDNQYNFFIFKKHEEALKFAKIRSFTQNTLIDIDIFKIVLIDIHIFRKALIDIDIFRKSLINIDIDILKNGLINIDTYKNRWFLY